MIRVFSWDSSSLRSSCRNRASRRLIAYQALLIEEFAKAGTTVMFVKGPRSDSP